jgi:hypothetical protein
MNDKYESGASSKANRSLLDKQFVMAMFFITGFFVFFAVAFCDYFATNELEVLKLVGTLFGGWVGTIIGFYFGQRPVEQIRQTLEDERQRTKELTEYITSRSKELWEKVERSKEKGES